MSNRHLMVPKTESAIKEFQVITNAGEIVLNYRNIIDVFGTIGTSHLSFQTPISTFRQGELIPSSINSVFSGDTDTFLSYSIGARTVLWSTDHLFLGVSGQYFYTRPHLNMFSDDYYSFQVTYIDGDHINYSEWQGSLGLTYAFQLDNTWQVMPYVNLTASHVSTDADNLRIPITNNYLGTLFNMKNQKTLGYNLGLSLIGGHRFSVALEAGFANENSCFLNIQFNL